MAIIRKKTDRESSIKVAFKEFEKEMSLIIKKKNLKFFFNDPNYNCDVYILKVYLNIKLDLIKPEKNRE